MAGPGGSLLRALKSILLARVSLGMVLAATVLGVPLGVQLGHAYNENLAPAPPPPDTVAPTIPTLLEPAHEAMAESRAPLFRWAESEDESLVKYALQYGVDPAFRVNAHNAIVFGMTEPFYQLPDEDAFPPGTTVYWRVLAIDAWQNASDWSETHRFSTGVE